MNTTGNTEASGCPPQGRELLDQAGWGALAQAVVYQACDDYRRVRRRLRACPDDRRACAAARSLERFFTSRWFTTISDLDGQALLRKLKEETA